MAYVFKKINEIEQNIETIKDDSLSSKVNTIVLEEIGNYIKRIFLLNKDNANSPTVNSWFFELRDEIKKISSIRKFIIVNTNVVKENQNRILSNTTLRSFYFEVYSSIVFRLKLDNEDKVLDQIFKKVLFVVTCQPCFLDDENIDNDNYLNLRTNDFKDLCSQVSVHEKAIVNFLSHNPWYYLLILMNQNAHEILDLIETLTDFSYGE